MTERDRDDRDEMEIKIEMVAEIETEMGDTD